MLNQVQGLIIDLDQLVEKSFVLRSERLAQHLKWLELRSPLTRVQTERQRLDEILRRIETGLVKDMQFRRLRQDVLQQNLEALNPLSVLRRGYAIVSHQDGRLISSISQVENLDELDIRLRDGNFSATARKGSRDVEP